MASEISSREHGDSWFRVFFDHFNEEIDVKTPIDSAGMSREDHFRRDNARFISSLERDHGVSGSRPIRMIGYGFQGHVWQLPDGNVMKTTHQGAEEAYDRAIDTMRRQGRGDPSGVSELRVLDAFKVITRGYGDNISDPHKFTKPALRYTAVVMDKIVPADKHPRLEAAMRDLLRAVAEAVQLSCLQFVVPERRDHYLEAMKSAESLEDLRMSGISPSQILRYEEEERYGWRSSDVVRGISPARALDRVANDFLHRVDSDVARIAAASQALRDLPEIVGSELHIRLAGSGGRDPVWWRRLKAAVAHEIRRGGGDIVPDNFGIDSKGDIIPFDM